MTAFPERLARVQERIAAAAQRSGRSFEQVVLVAVTKKQPPSAIEEAFSAGVRRIGENYVQEASHKQEQLGNLPGDWHLLGHLQTNKAGLAVKTFDLIQSVDSLRLAGNLGRQAALIGKTQDVLLQVHMGDEATKFGLPPDEAADVAAAVALVPGLTLRGLMGIAPQGEDPRPHFRRLRRHFDELPSRERQILSMGMTGDFETAIEEGATMVRIGTALFGPRTT